MKKELSVQTQQARVLRRMAYGKFRELDFEESVKNLRTIFTKKSKRIINRAGFSKSSMDEMREYYIRKILKSARREKAIQIQEKMEVLEKEFDLNLKGN